MGIGTNYDRPGFQKMLSEIEACNVAMCIVKGLSRLGRNYPRVTFSTELILPENGAVLLLSTTAWAVQTPATTILLIYYYLLCLPQTPSIPPTITNPTRLSPHPHEQAVLLYIQSFPQASDKMP